MNEAYILFEVAETIYAVRSDQVQQMDMIEQITRVPNAADFIEGVVYLRGQVVPVINLRKRFGFEKAPYDIRSRLIVINLDQRVVGLAVDSAREFVQIDQSQILPTPEDLKVTNGDYLSGVVLLKERLILVLDVKKILDHKEQDAISSTVK